MENYTPPMLGYGQVFVRSVEHALSNYLGDSVNEIKAFIAHVVLQEKPYLMITNEGLKHCQALVFSKETIRDFVLTLTFHFFSRVSASDNSNELVNICAGLAEGLSYRGYGENLSQDRMPSDISTRLEDTKTAFSTLRANKWLVTLMLLQLFISAAPEPARSK